MPAGIPAINFPLADPSHVRETFADSLGISTFDGHTLRMEFCVVRMENVEDSTKAKMAPRGHRNVVTRLVMDTEGAVELVNQCLRFAAIMEKNGLIRRNPPQVQSAENAN